MLLAGVSDGSPRHICQSNSNSLRSSATAFGISSVDAPAQMSAQPLRTLSLDCWIRILQGGWGGRTCLITLFGQKHCRECPCQRSRSWRPLSATTAWLLPPSTQQHPRHLSHLVLLHRQDLLADQVPAGSAQHAVGSLAGVAQTLEYALFVKHVLAAAGR